MFWLNGVLYDMSLPPVWSVDWSVTVDGRDMTQGLRPYLIDLSTTDQDGTSGDKCSLTLDDSDGDIDLDIEGRAIEIAISEISVFTGVVESARSQGSRNGGKLAMVTGTGFDTRGKAKEAQAFHKDEASLKDFLGDAAKQAGFELVIDDALGSIRRDYWQADYESFLDLGEKLAREFHGTFKLRGNKAVLVERGTTDLPPIDAVVGPGGNVLGWDLAPFTGRAAYKRAEARYFDRKEGKYKTETVDIDLDGDPPEVTNRVRMPMADKNQAGARAKGRKGEAKRNRGGGSIELDITPRAQAEGIIILSGARRQIDGPYRMATVGHKVNRAGGSTTRVDVKEPGAK